ncbi:outer membrane protein assembly factor BamD [Acetobacteroides hydrogenigenes]|uniref:Outer membrane protein assembly factor BamD n=1 Tax=Acetobacteroides hydrogenigenes TaxID=979970 RepID=A0A4R2EY36_9BACT|nr:outer membrane protein assembly factor BamD [Acetobacteroides hydrogenigenes]TCN72827.1 outer membrane protein assembly factor BamD [Acetobacteroides hydrogenigenes]
MKRKYEVILIVSVIALFLSSCSGFDKILKSNDYELKYKKAIEYMNKKDFYRASQLFDQITTVYQGTNRDDSVNYFMAKCEFGMENYEGAATLFDSFRNKFPRSVFTEEAEFLFAYSYYKQSPRVELDQTSTSNAIIQMQEFCYKYPQSAKVVEAKKIIKEMREKLMEKSYISSKLYFDMGGEYYKSAIVAIKRAINEFPDSKHHEEQLYMIVKASYEYANNSIPEKKKERFQEVVDHYYTLIAEYPETKYKKEVDEMLSVATKIIKN